MKYPASLLLLLLFLTGCSDEVPSKQPLSAEMVAAKKRALALCSGCHGPTGVGTSPISPNLAGQKKAYMVKQLMDFRSGERANYPPMTHIARMLTEEEIKLISQWYESLYSPRNL